MKKLLVLFFILCTTLGYAEEQTIKIAAFNIQVLGISKMGKPEVVKTLVDIITKYDLVAIQEIRDKSQTAIKNLLKEVNKVGTYAMVVGPRLGRSSSKEQYAFMYDIGKLTCVDYYTLEDKLDKFHREPLVARFKVPETGFTFGVAVLHTDPDETNEELSHLEELALDMIKTFEYNSNTIILGDLNADCATFIEQGKEVLLPGYAWVIPDSADTTIHDTDCAYDRILVTKYMMQRATGQQGVFKFDQEYGLTKEQALKVSDHYPVWIEIKTN